MDFLEAHRGTAFNAFEVYAGMEGLSSEAAAILALVVLTTGRERPRWLAECQAALEALVEEGRIESASFHGATQYHARTT